MGERVLASVQRVIRLESIAGADRIECATVLGWQCVVLKKDDFQVGELAVYIEIDSKVPERPEFEFLRERKFRVRTIKLKKQISQGLLLPLSILPDGIYKEGNDVSDLLGVTKYDPEGDKEQTLLDQQVAMSNNKIHRFFGRYPWYRKLFFKPKKDRFPKFISKTDETRIQNIPHIVDTEKDTTFIETEKLDGQSGTYFLIRNPKRMPFFGKKYIFGVCSRNIHLLKEDNSSYWTIARQLNIEKVLENLIGDEKFVVLQGEILGEGIQENKYKVTGYDFYAFNLKYPNTKIDSVEARETLAEYQVKFVPILNADFKLEATVNEMVEHAKAYKSTLSRTGSTILREGVVIRNYEKDISFKVINPEFLLKNNL